MIICPPSKKVIYYVTEQQPKFTRVHFDEYLHARKFSFENYMFKVHL